MTYLPPAPPPGLMPSASYRRGRPVSAAVAIVLLVLSGFGLICATAFDFFLWLTAGGVDASTPHAQAVAVASTVVVGWIVATAVWWVSLVLVVRAISRANPSWLIALGSGIVVGGLQIATWAIVIGVSS